MTGGESQIPNTTVLQIEQFDVELFYEQLPIRGDAAGETSLCLPGNFGTSGRTRRPDRTVQILLQGTPAARRSQERRTSRRPARAGQRAADASVPASLRRRRSMDG